MKRTVIAKLALSVMLAAGAKAQCPDRYVTTHVDRFNPGIKVIETPRMSAGGGGGGIIKMEALMSSLPPVKDSPAAASRAPAASTTAKHKTAAQKKKDAEVAEIMASAAKTIADYDAKVAKLTSRFILSFGFVGGSGYNFINCHTVAILADDKVVEVDSTEDSPGVGSELVYAYLSADAVAQLGRAQKIEYKICNGERTATPEFVQAVHEFACKVAQQSSGAMPNPAPSSSTSPPPR